MAAKNPVHEQLTHLQDELAQEGVHNFTRRSEQNDNEVIEALGQVLSKLGWRGEDRHIYDALPQSGALDDVAEFRAILARLNFETQLLKINPTGLSKDVLPSLYVAGSHKTQVILEKQADRLKILNASNNSTETLRVEELKGKIFQISAIDTKARHSLISQYGWMGILIRRFRPLLVQLLCLTLLTNILALSAPVFIMNIFDKVIISASTAFLGYLFAGIAIIMAAEFALGVIRARMLAYLGARFDAVLNLAAFQQILHLPVAMTESLSVGVQTSRLKQFEGIREIFTNPLAVAILDMPFVLFYLAAIAVLGGAIAWVPLVVIVIYIITGVIAFPLKKKQLAISGETRVRSQNFLHELATKHPGLRDGHGQSAWFARFRKITSTAALSHFRSQQTAHISQILAHSTMLMAVLACLGIGASRVMAGDMTGGALIAVAALAWRALLPFQTVVAHFSSLPQVMISYRQLNHLMQLKPERSPGTTSLLKHDLGGDVSMKNVSFRYEQHSEPALIGMSLNIPSGQLVALAGPNGSGKTTLLNIILGLYRVQTGSIYFDGLDMRQIDMGLLRHEIALVPQKTAFFKGTIEQNIRLSYPKASRADIEHALKQANAYQAVEALPRGLQTQLTGEMQGQLPNDLKQRLILARAYVKQAPIYLLDEPANGLDQIDDQAFCARLEALRGKSTVIMATHNKNHMQLCDRVIYLEKGQLIHDGKPQQVLPLIKES